MKDLRSTPDARSLALDALLSIEGHGVYANVVVDELLESRNLRTEERHLMTELVYGVTRMKLALDWILDQYSRRKSGDLHPTLLSIVRMGIYQLFYLSRIHPGAIVNEAVNLAKKRGHAGWGAYTNGTLRAIHRQKDHIHWPDPLKDPALYLSIYHSHPIWLVRRWIAARGIEETAAMCMANNQQPPMILRTNRLKITRDELVRRLESQGITTHVGRYAPEAIWVTGMPPLRSMQDFADGLFYVQDESSMLVAHILNPDPDSRLLDLCSAPGGKATHLAERMGDTGSVTAMDVNENKLKDIQASATRLGIHVIHTIAADASQPMTQFAPGFDGVLADVPCSGTGVIRRRADSRWRKTESQILNLVPLQAEILHQGAQMVRPGGVLVYSTCSVEPEENVEQVIRFLANEPGFALDDMGQRLCAYGLTNDALVDGAMQLLSNRHGTDGFFAARFVRMV